MGSKNKDYLTRAEHEEFCLRMEAHHHRSDERTGLLERKVDALEEKDGTTQVLMSKVDLILEEQQELKSKMDGFKAPELHHKVSQIEEDVTTLKSRVGSLEGEDGKKYRKIWGWLVGGIIGVLAAMIGTRLFGA